MTLCNMMLCNRFQQLVQLSKSVGQGIHKLQEAIMSREVACKKQVVDIEVKAGDMKRTHQDDLSTIKVRVSCRELKYNHPP